MRLASTFAAVAFTALAGCAAAPATDTQRGPHAHRGGAPAPAGYERQMKMMQEMHQKMAAAKTPEERAALMNDHMKTMHEGMAMMGQMRGGAEPMSMDAPMMNRRMDMMEMMMQMMMDRQGVTPPAGAK